MKKILFWLFLFFLLFKQIFAFDASLVSNKTNYNLWDNINISLKLETTKWWKFQIKTIKWLENFNIIWQSQSQSSASSVEIINWVTKSVTKTTLNLDLILQAKKSWKFEIWPAIISDWKNEIKTNSIVINIWKWFSSLLGTSKIIQNNNVSNSVNNINKNDLWWNENLNVKKYSESNLSVYVLFLIVLLWVIWTLLFLYNKWLLFENKKINKKEWEEQNDFVELNKENDEKINFEERKEIEIKYPSLEDDDFEEKIDKIFRQKIYKEFHIKDIDSLTYNEILEKINDNDKKEKIKEIIDLLMKIKYSNIILDKNKVLDLIKNM